ncbi:B12-binding domain-containing radical SAM protein [Candidatus Sumerlaeota bacterium]|nr:B12-binding domain-containing radical SAM protein [Candidatus Sumerlaeota bacterium]
MFKIAFMRAYYADDPYQASMPPLGIGYLIAHAKQRLAGIDVAYCRTVEEALEYQPDLLAISSATENFLDARRNAASIKAELGIPVVGGGMHLTALPRNLPPEFDVGAYGEGELTFSELVQLYMANRQPSANDFNKIDGLIFRQGDGVALSARRAEIKNLDELPYPDRDAMGDQWLKPSWQQVHMISSRGCPYDCAFCSSSKHWKGVRYFSEEYTAREIEYLRGKYNPQEVYFFDDLMVANKRRFKRLCETFRERGTHKGVVFRTYARVDLIDDELADLFEEYNFKYIDFGFESNNTECLEYYNKRLASPEINQRAIDILRPRRISVGANLILGAPPETREMAMESYDFIERNADCIERFSCGLLLALPGTEVWEQAMRRGLVSEEMDWSILGFNSVPDSKKNFADYPMMCEGMTREELFKVYLMFKEQMQRINQEGEKRYWFEQYSQKAQQANTLGRELAALRGSRLVRVALWLRGLKRRLFGGGDGGSIRRDS